MLSFKNLACALLVGVLPGCSIGGEAEEEQQLDMASPIGLYRVAGDSAGTGQLCIDKGRDGNYRFALVTSSSNRAACGGAGRVSLSGSSFQLTMGGDERCEIATRVEGRDLIFARELPEGCSYYCSPDASLAGRSFTKKGDTVAAAAKAVDLVGDRLCR